MNNPGICILSTVHLCFDVRMFQAEARTLARGGFAVTLIARREVARLTSPPASCP